MAVKLSRRAYQHAQQLVKQGKVVIDDRGAWSEHQPTTAEENAFIAERGYEEYGRWHLGIDDSRAADTKARYSFPYGDFSDVHRCAVLSAESRAAQYDHQDIKSAAAHLHGMLEAVPVRTSS